MNNIAQHNETIDRGKTITTNGWRKFEYITAVLFNKETKENDLMIQWHKQINDLTVLWSKIDEWILCIVHTVFVDFS